MSTQENVRIARAHYELFNRRDFDRCALLVAGCVEWTSVPSGRRFQGLSGYQRFVENWTIAFPDARVEILNLVAAEDWVVAEFTGQGTHRGRLAGLAGPLPPTGRRMHMPFCEVLQIRNCRIVNGRLYFDVATLMDQLGFSGPV